MSLPTKPSHPKLLRLPDQGRLLVAADLRGNLRDFLAVAGRFEQMSGDAHLLLLGDLIHGPYASESEWDGELGRYYRDESPALLLKLSLLQEKHPGRVHALLGNHEHAHIGGPRTARFAADEALVLEQRLGDEAAAWLRSWLLEWPLLCATPCGVLLAHGAPGVRLHDPEELEQLDYARFRPPGLPEAHDEFEDEPETEPRRSRPAQLLGQLLWTQSLSPEAARAVLQVLGCQVLVHGRDVVRGKETIGQEQLVLSTSFALPDPWKRVLQLDLSGRYDSVASLREGIEIQPLY